MPKKNPNTPPAGPQKAAPAGPKWRYVGPFYTKHIVQGDGFIVKPFHLTLADGEVEAFVAKYPDRAAWFELIEEQAAPSETSEVSKTSEV